MKSEEPVSGTVDVLRYGVDRQGISDRMVARVLDSADHCVSDLGFDRTTMSAVAREAGVSRNTLHRLFATRDQMLTALGLRQIDRLLAYALPRAMRRQKADERIVELALAWAYGLPDDSRFSEAFRSEEIRSKLADLVSGAPETVALVTDFLAKILADAPDVDRLCHPDDIVGMAIVVRQFGREIRQDFGGTSSARAHRAHLHRYLVPALFHDEDGA